MDPLVLASIVGLVFAGQRLSKSDNPPITTDDVVMLKPKIDRTNNFGQQDFQLDPKNIFSNSGRAFNGFNVNPKEIQPAFTDVTPIGRRNPYGQPVYDLYNRELVSNKMNNVPPISQHTVGRGLGVGADVPAAGGFHQFFRVLPANINEENLHTLPGAMANGVGGPPNAVIKAGGPVAPNITHEAKDTKAWHRNPMQTSGQGQGGALRAPEGHPDQIKTRRMTNRDETGQRTGDALQIGTASYFVKEPYAVGTATYTDTRLTRGTNNRINPDRAGNGQRMNVRADPVGQVGAMTNLLPESVPFPVGAPNPMKFFNPHKNADYYKFNPFKMNPNPRADPKFLDTAIAQLQKNELAQKPLAAI